MMLEKFLLTHEDYALLRESLAYYRLHFEGQLNYTEDVTGEIHYYINSINELVNKLIEIEINT